MNKEKIEEILKEISEIAGDNKDPTKVLLAAILIEIQDIQKILWNN